MGGALRSFHGHFMFSRPTFSPTSLPDDEMPFERDRCLPSSWLKRPSTHRHSLFPVQHHFTRAAMGGALRSFHGHSMFHSPNFSPTFWAEVPFERDACQEARSSDLPRTFISFSHCNTIVLEQPWVGPFAHSMATPCFTRPTFRQLFGLRCHLSEMLAKKLAQATFHAPSFPLPNATPLYLSSHGWGPSLISWPLHVFSPNFFARLFG